MYQHIYLIAAKTNSARCVVSKTIASCIPQSFPSDMENWAVDAQNRVCIYHADAIGHDLMFSGNITRADFAECFQRYADVTTVELIDRLQTQSSDIASLVIWSSFRQELLIIRGKTGLKQLFARESRDFYFVSTDLTSLLKIRVDGQNSLDLPSAYNYLLVGHPLSGHTMSENVYSVPAGHYALWSRNNGYRVKRYWSPLSGTAMIDKAEIAAALNSQISSDVAQSTAILLSSGLDSSYIASIAARLNQSLVAFTLRPDNSDDADESPLASRFCQQLGYKHVPVDLSVRDALRELPIILRSAQPCSAWATIGHKCLLDAARADHSTILSGLGSDEIFGGYDAYIQYYERQMLYIRRLEHSEQQKQLQSLLRHEHGRRYLFPGVASFFDEESLRVRHLCGDIPSRRQATLTSFYQECVRIRAQTSLFQGMVAHECHNRIPELLLPNFSMISESASVTCVYPFLSPSVIERAIWLDLEDRFEWAGSYWRSKVLMRSIAADLMPQEILHRPPASYTVPFVNWLRDKKFANAVRERIGDSTLKSHPCFSPQFFNDVIANISGDERRNGAIPAEEIWSVLTLCSWFDEFCK